MWNKRAQIAHVQALYGYVTPIVTKMCDYALSCVYECNLPLCARMPWGVTT